MMPYPNVQAAIDWLVDWIGPSNPTPTPLMELEIADSWNSKASYGVVTTIGIIPEAERIKVSYISGKVHEGVIYVATSINRASYENFRTKRYDLEVPISLELFARYTGQENHQQLVAAFSDTILRGKVDSLGDTASLCVPEIGGGELPSTTGRIQVIRATMRAKFQVIYDG